MAGQNGVASETRILIGFRCEKIKKGAFESHEFSSRQTWGDVLEFHGVPNVYRVQQKYAIQTIKNKLGAQLNERIEVLHGKLKNQARKGISVRLVEKETATPLSRVVNSGHEDVVDVDGQLNSAVSSNPQNKAGSSNSTKTVQRPWVNHSHMLQLGIKKGVAQPSKETMPNETFDGFDDSDDDDMVSQYGDEKEEASATRERALIMEKLNDPILPDKYFREGKSQYHGIPPTVMKQLHKTCPDLMSILHHAFQDKSK